MADILTIMQFAAESPEGKNMCKKLGAVNTILPVLEAQDQNDLIVQACSGALTVVVTEGDVVKVVERLQASLQVHTPDHKLASTDYFLHH